VSGGRGRVFHCADAGRACDFVVRALLLASRKSWEIRAPIGNVIIARVLVLRRCVVRGGW
jgi:hypothetical protein